MKNLLHLFVAVATIMLFVPAVSAWDDNFDSYVLGSGLHGQGNWEGWDNDPAFDAFVSDVQFSSSPHSVAIDPTSDIVQPFSEYTGEWIMTSWHYIPTGSTGDQYWILCNTYPTVYNEDWSLQLKFESASGNMIIMEGSMVVPIVYDQWIEVKVEINLGTDTQNIYYNGVFLESINWSSGGAIAIGCLDLFSDGGSTIYWDDCSPEPAGALEQTTWGQIKTSL